MNFRRTIFRYYLHHVLFWLVVAGVWFYLRYQDYPTLQRAVWVTIVKVLDLALIIYFANLVLVPKLLYKKKYGWFVLTFILAIAATSFLKMLVLAWIQNDILDSSNMKQKVYNNFVTQFFLVLASIGLKSVFDYLKLQKKLVEVAKEKAEAELNFLKSQINPHFLFNSLNSVYFLIDKNNAPAREALHKFSEMLRYQLYECNGEKIPVEKEISYLKDYVDLQRLRINENCSVNFNCSPDVKNFAIEPLLLIPFVENAFKHLSHFSNGKRNEVQINISRNDGAMNFSVNNTTEGKQREEVQSGGIGLNNVKKRLELLYPDKHKLNVADNDGWFNVQLEIKID
ncbi:MAG: histidine kinase [Chitinophagaceae bacterium]|nr:histidine kinase [Chitinophagaceae bacterium]